MKFLSYVLPKPRLKVLRGIYLMSLIYSSIATFVAQLMWTRPNVFLFAADGIYYKPIPSSQFYYLYCNFVQDTLYETPLVCKEY